MKLLILSGLLVPMFAVAARAGEPPYHVPDPAIMEDLRIVFDSMEKHQHTGSDGSSSLAVISSSQPAGSGYNVSVGSSDIVANDSSTITVRGATAIFFPMISHLNTSSLTCVVSQWASSFSITNTSGSDSKKVNWWVLWK